MDRPELFRLDGKKALVTGASRGIGLAVAKALADQGADVVITGRKADALETVARQLRDYGGQVSPRICHQGDSQAVRSLFFSLDGDDFQPEIVVINAATNPVMGPLLDTDLAAWQKIVDVNLTGVLVTAQEAGKRMAARGHGSLIVVSSVAGLDPMPGLGAYSITKSGVIAMAKLLAKELGPSGVRVNALAPGLIETQFSSAIFQNEKMYRDFIRQVPLRRHGQPDDLVGAVLFLASDASAYVTGQVLVVDGGSRV